MTSPINTPGDVEFPELEDIPAPEPSEPGECVGNYDESAPECGKCEIAEPCEAQTPKSK